mmetsp:Transcript_106128/g.257793  ORF Transcript_106128/g.257793 Transcript_106128/m.257793 type:complete len:91 (-) Transcript_106128:263-535(-)
MCLSGSRHKSLRSTRPLWCPRLCTPTATPTSTSARLLTWVDDQSNTQLEDAYLDHLIYEFLFLTKCPRCSAYGLDCDFCHSCLVCEDCQC